VNLSQFANALVFASFENRAPVDRVLRDSRATMLPASRIARSTRPARVPCLPSRPRNLHAEKATGKFMNKSQSRELALGVLHHA
jgi:hypothetical protein